MAGTTSNDGVLRSHLLRFSFVFATAAMALSLSPGATAQAASKGDHGVEVKLTAYKLEAKDGKESLVDASSAKPGDVIEYRVTYLNVSSQAVRDVSAVLPIPVGTLYVDNSARPREISARTGEVGAKYIPVPLTPAAANADASKNVPAAYRYVRWQLQKLDAGEHKVVSARVQLVAPQAGAAVLEKSIAPADALRSTIAAKK